MNNIQKKTYIDKDETDSMEKKQTNENKNWKKKQIVCTYNNMTSTDYKQYTILSMIILLPIIRIKLNERKCLFNHISHHTTLILQGM